MNYLKATRGVKNTLLWSCLMLLPLIPVLMTAYGFQLTGVRTRDLILIIGYFIVSITVTVDVMPWAACVAGTRGGVIPMAVGVVSNTAALGILFGTTGSAIGFLLTGVPAFVFLMVCEKKMDFGRAAGIMTAVWAAVHLIIWTGLCLMAPGGDVYAAAANAVTDRVTQIIGTGEGLLELAKQFQLADVSMETAGQALGNWVYDLLPDLTAKAVVRNSILFGVGGAALSLRRGQASTGELTPGEPFPRITVPAAMDWGVPREWAIALFLMAGGALIRMICGKQNMPLYLAGSVIYEVFEAVYCLLGVAAFETLLDRGKMQTAPETGEAKKGKLRRFLKGLCRTIAPLGYMILIVLLPWLILLPGLVKELIYLGRQNENR